MSENQKVDLDESVGNIDDALRVGRKGVTKDYKEGEDGEPQKESVVEQGLEEVTHRTSVTNSPPPVDEERNPPSPDPDQAPEPVKKDE